jgi:DNA-binding NarL/FixJ family response regulator
MQNNEIRIYVVGSIKAFGVYRSLSGKYVNVYHFKDEIQNDLLEKLPPHIVIIEESEKSASILNRIKLNNYCHVIYLSSNINFNHIVGLIKQGVSDYVLKDTCMYYSIQQSVRRATKLPLKMSESFSEKVFIDTCSLKKRYPLRFRLAEWFS